MLDYRASNRVTRKDTVPMPHTENMLDQIIQWDANFLNPGCLNWILADIDGNRLMLRSY